VSTHKVRQSPGALRKGDGLGRQLEASRPRERILNTARDLFHKYGIRSIGVETIAYAAGTNKMTLYRHFKSKDDLILECLRESAKGIDDMWRELETAFPGDPLGQLHGWLQEGAECISNDGRGCDFANAAVEFSDIGHPIRSLIEDVKAAHREHLIRLCKAARIGRPELLADTLSLLLEGARVSRQSVGAEGPSAKFVRMGEEVILVFSKNLVAGSSIFCDESGHSRTLNPTDAPSYDLTEKS